MKPSTHTVTEEFEFATKDKYKLTLTIKNGRFDSIYLRKISASISSLSLDDLQTAKDVHQVLGEAISTAEERLS